MIKVDLSGAGAFFDVAGPDYAAAAAAHRLLAEKTGRGAEYTGWTELPRRILGGELRQILTAADRIRSGSQALVVIGIGGSYLGAKAAVDLLTSANYNLLENGNPKIFFIGNTVSADAIEETAEMLGDRDFSLNVISKSGTTLEPALSFRVFKSLLEKKYGMSAKKRIIATTDAHGGVLREMAEKEGYETFHVPGDVGGRYSVLSAVGLLPMAVAGIDISMILEAADEQMRRLIELRSPENPAWQYAAARQHLYGRGRYIEVLASYEPSFRYMAEWWKQLFGESEGKDGVGIYPASVEYSADLHSMGQYIQDGPRTLMETVVSFTESRRSLKVPFVMGDPDGLNYLAGRDFDAVGRTISEAVKSAHISGGVPNISIEAKARDEQGFAELVCFFEVACAISGYILGVNPFNQPGVEAYKKNMFDMLEREDY